MKELKMKDIVLGHYTNVYETEMDGVTVRVFKPKTMGKLPSYAMQSELDWRVRDAKNWELTERGCRKVQWWLGNPDYGVWDAQIVRRFNPRTMTLDFYFASIIIRPYSRQAYDWYREHSCVGNPVARLALMWDSRNFDRNGGYDTSYGAYQNQDEVNGYLYSGKQVAPYDCITDPKFDPCPLPDDFDNGDFDDDTDRRCVKFKATDEEIIYNAVMGKDEAKRDGGTELMHDCAKVFCDFRKLRPEVTEMHFYTDQLLDTSNEE